jgi:uncharacterized membrane protein YgcG
MLVDLYHLISKTMKQLFTILLSVFVFQFLSAQGYVIDSFIVDLTINKNGIVHVSEKIFSDFLTEKRGIYRDIPYKVKRNGAIYTTDITDLKCTNHEYKVSSASSSKRLKIGNKKIYLTGKNIYDIQYNIEGPFLQNEDSQEFYWNITGNRWDTDINAVKVAVHLPDELQIRYNNLQVFTGKEGSTNKDGVIAQYGNTIYGYTNNALHENEGMTLAIKLPEDYITGKTLHLNKLQTFASQPKEQWPMSSIPLALIGGLLAFWLKMKKRIVEDATPIDPSPYPPVDLNPAEVGTFYDHIVHDRDVMSLLPYWANQGYIKVRFDNGNDEMVFEKLKSLEGVRPDYENYFFNEIFKNRDAIALSEIKYNYASTLYEVKKMIHTEIKDLQLYDDEYRYWFKSWRIWILLSLFIPAAIASFVFGYWLMGVFFLLGVAAVIVVGSWYPKLSQHGINVNRDLRAFYAFLKSNETDKARDAMAKDDQYFEKVYPYAVALNLDKRFMHIVKPYRSTAPYWFYYGGINNHRQSSFENFSNDYSPKEISSAFSSSSPGTSGGGFSGGGSSGGGFGGGGGGSW